MCVGVSAGAVRCVCASSSFVYFSCRRFLVLLVRGLLVLVLVLFVLVLVRLLASRMVPSWSRQLGFPFGGQRPDDPVRHGLHASAAAGALPAARVHPAGHRRERPAVRVAF